MARSIGKARIVPLAAGWAALVCGLTVVAQAPQAVPKTPTPKDPTVQNVTITTVDGVDLAGTYYRSPRAKEAPCVILLHRLGTDRSTGGWDAIARQLRGDKERQYAVLTFDFRGHGESKNVNPNFWKFSVNKDFITTSQDKTKITSSQFKSGYFPWLVNDILAARKFLDIKNDSGELNVNSLFLIGAQEGASLGELFVATEWSRTYTVGFKALLTMGTKHVGGEDIAGCVWLSLVQRPNNINFDYNNWLKTPSIRDKTAMLLVFGERDTNARQTADNVFRTLTSGREKNKHTQKFEVKSTDLAGQALLSQPALGATAKMMEFMDKVLTDRRAIPWASVAQDENPLNGVPLKPFGFSKMP